MDKSVKLVLILLLGLGFVVGSVAAVSQENSWWKNRMAKGKETNSTNETGVQKWWNTKTGTNYGQMKKADGKTSVSGVCMQTAVENRDSAIINAVDVFSGQMTSALSKRKEELKSAWAIEDQKSRAVALKNALIDFQGSWKAAGQEMKKAKDAAWRDYVTYVRKNCGIADALATADNSVLDAIATN